jgi:hypothetical protein
MKTGISSGNIYSGTYGVSYIVFLPSLSIRGYGSSLGVRDRVRDRVRGGFRNWGGPKFRVRVSVRVAVRIRVRVRVRVKVRWRWSWSRVSWSTWSYVRFRVGVRVTF